MKYALTSDYASAPPAVCGEDFLLTRDWGLDPVWIGRGVHDHSSSWHLEDCKSWIISDKLVANADVVEVIA